MASSNAIDQLAQFRRIYGHAAADNLERQLVMFLKMGYQSHELTIIYPRGSAPEIEPKSMAEEHA